MAVVRIISSTKDADSWGVSLVVPYLHAPRQTSTAPAKSAQRGTSETARTPPPSGGGVGRWAGLPPQSLIGNGGGGAAVWVFARCGAWVVRIRQESQRGKKSCWGKGLGRVRERHSGWCRLRSTYRGTWSMACIRACLACKFFSLAGTFSSLGGLYVCVCTPCVCMTDDNNSSTASAADARKSTELPFGTSIW